MQRLIKNFKQAVSKLWQERWNALAGGVLLAVLCAIVIILSGCAPAAPTASDAQPIAPNVAAVYANQTAEAYADQSALARQQADQYNSQSTATSAAATSAAFEPYAAATSAAVNLQIQKMYSDATSTAAAQTQTAYAEQQVFMAQSTTIAGQATQTAQAANEAQRLIIESNNRKIERDQTNNTMRAVVWYALLFVLSIIGVARAYVWIKGAAYIPNPVDERGKPQPMIEVINAVSWDIDRSANGVIGATQDFLKRLPLITAERQDIVTEHAQMVDMQTRIHGIPKRLMDSQSMKFLSAPADESREELADMHDAELLLPAWNVINGWDGQSRPLGLGSKGIIIAQAASPHLLTTGGTGSGKTAFMLRTQATASLAKGYQVINLGFSDSGFGVFADHPNYHSIKLSQSSDVIDCLASVYKELKERKQIIGGESIEWEHWRAGVLPPRPFVDVLIDELGNLADDIYTSEETSKEGAVKTMQLWRWMSMIAKEGRKVGIRFLAALQDPTAKSVNLSFRRNCTLVSFQLGDASQSRSFIGVAGAELLQVGHFMTRNFSGNEGVIVGGGFAPTDDEIKAYLRLHPAPQTPAPTWIEGTLVNQATLPGSEPIRLSAPAPTQSKGEFVNGLSEWEVRVLDLYEAGLNQAQIVESVFAGDNLVIGANAVADLIKRWQTVKHANMGSDAQAELDRINKENEIEAARKRADEDMQIRLLHAKDPKLSKTNIVYEIWGTSGTSFKEHMAQVKEVLGATATAASNKEPDMSLNGALPA